MPAATLITRDDPAELGYVLRPMSATGTAVSFSVGTAGQLRACIAQQQRDSGRYEGANVRWRAGKWH
jgi:hypothetical protein